MTAIYDVSLDDDELSPFTSLKGSPEPRDLSCFPFPPWLRIWKKQNKKVGKQIRANGELGGPPLLVGHVARKHSCCCRRLVLTSRTDLSLNLGFPDESFWLLMYAFYHWCVYTVCIDFPSSSSPPQVDPNFVLLFINLSVCVYVWGWELLLGWDILALSNSFAAFILFKALTIFSFFLLSSFHCMFSLASSLEMDRNIRPSAAVTLRPWPSLAPRPDVSVDVEPS